MLEQILSFVLMFLIGCLGAGIFLLMLLLATKDIDILENKIVNNQTTMAALYICAGGFVAAIIQMSTGIPMAVNHLQAIFMLGFGWQGVLSGIGAAGYAKNKGEEFRDKKSIIEEVVAANKRQSENAINYLKERLKEMEGLLGKGGSVNAY